MHRSPLSWTSMLLSLVDRRLVPCHRWTVLRIQQDPINVLIISINFSIRPDRSSRIQSMPLVLTTVMLATMLVNNHRITVRWSKLDRIPVFTISVDHFESLCWRSSLPCSVWSDRMEYRWVISLRNYRGWRFSSLLHQGSWLRDDHTLVLPTRSQHVHVLLWPVQW